MGARSVFTTRSSVQEQTGPSQTIAGLIHQITTRKSSRNCGPQPSNPLLLGRGTMLLPVSTITQTTSLHRATGSSLLRIKVARTQSMTAYCSTSLSYQERMTGPRTCVSDPLLCDRCLPHLASLPVSRILFTENPERKALTRNPGAVENGSWPLKGILNPPAEPVTQWFLSKPHYEVDHCLLQQPPWTEKKCQLEYSPWILWLVCAFNLTKMAVIFTIWQSNRRTKRSRSTLSGAQPLDEPLDTLGDAIASFMRNRDKHTIDMGLASSRDFQKPLRLPWRPAGSEQCRAIRGPQPWKPQDRRWMQAADMQRWILFLVT